MQVAASYPLNLIALSSHTPGSLRCTRYSCTRTCARYSSVYSTHLDFGGILSPSLSVPSLLPSVPLQVRPSLRLWDLGERISSPAGPGRSPAAKRIFVHFRHKLNCTFLIAWWRIISCSYCPLKESFRDIFVIHCPAEKKIYSTQVWQPFVGNCNFWRGNLPTKRCLD